MTHREIATKVLAVIILREKSFDYQSRAGKSPIGNYTKPVSNFFPRFLGVDEKVTK